MVSAHEITQDFEMLDKDLEGLERGMKRLSDYSTKVAPSELQLFVKFMRNSYEAGNKLLAAERSARSSALAQEDAANRADKDITHMLDRIRKAETVAPQRLGDMLESSLDRFLKVMNLEVRFHSNTKYGFTSINGKIKTRMEGLAEILKTFSDSSFNAGLVSHFGVDEIRKSIGLLNGSLYPELLQSLRMLDALIAEFNSNFRTIYDASRGLEFMKDVDMKKPGLLGRIFGKKEAVKPVLALSQSDVRKIVAMQTVVAGIVEKTVPAIRGRQKMVLESLHHIKVAESRLFNVFKKSFGRGEQRLYLRRAA